MKKVSESLTKGIESFLEFTPEVSAHLENAENPHAVTKSQVGLGSVKNEEQATKAEFNEHKGNRENPHSVTKEQVGLGNLKNSEQATKAEFLSHKENLENPHAVTKEQIGLENVKNEEQATKEEFLEEQERVTAHLENTQNPHFVTKEQIGLGKVKNEEQATNEQYIDHVSGNRDRHSGADIMYSDTKSVNEKIDELLVESGSGTMYHDELLNRDNENQHPISAISGLRSELDTLSANFNGISHSTLSGRDIEGAHPISAISGLSEKLDEVLVFEGVTTDAVQTRLKCVNSSEFICDEDYFFMPNGYCADMEISVLAAREQSGIIKDRNVVLFSFKGVIAKMNSMTNHADVNFTVYENKTSSDGTAPSYKCIFHKNGVEFRDLLVTGEAGHRVFWKAIIRLKNIMKVEAEV